MVDEGWRCLRRIYMVDDSVVGMVQVLEEIANDGVGGAGGRRGVRKECVERRVDDREE